MWYFCSYKCPLQHSFCMFHEMNIFKNFSVFLNALQPGAIRAPGSCGKWSLSGPVSMCKSHVGDSTLCSTTRDQETPRPACSGTESANATSGCTPATGFSSEAPVAYLWVPQSWDRECALQSCALKQSLQVLKQENKGQINYTPPPLFFLFLKRSWNCHHHQLLNIFSYLLLCGKLLALCRFWGAGIAGTGMGREEQELFDKVSSAGLNRLQCSAKVTCFEYVSKSPPACCHPCLL